MSSGRVQQRKGNFKKGIDQDEARRKRQEYTFDIRKAKREESLMKKRREGTEGNDEEEIEDEEIQETHLQKSELAAIVQGIYSEDPQVQHRSVMAIRKTLSIEKNPPIQDVIESGVVPRLIQLLSSTADKIPFEAAWALTNVASGTSDQTRYVVQCGAVPPLLMLLQSPDGEVKDQVAWALGNIAGDGPLLRDILLSAGAMEYLLPVFTNTAPLSLIRNATWTLSNFCRGKPAPPFDKVRIALPLIHQLLQVADKPTLIDACWACSYLTDGPNDKIQAAIDAGLVPYLVQLMNHESSEVYSPALRAVGNIVTGDETQTQIILQCNPLPILQKLLGSSRKVVRKEACWTISNITAGTKDQIQQVIDAGIIPLIVHLLDVGEFEVKKEATWAISNAVTGGNPQQIAYLVNQGCVKPLCDMLGSSDSKIIMVTLETLEDILKAGEDLKLTENPYAILIEEADGLDLMEKLQEHKSNEISRKAMSILEKYYLPEDENMLENQQNNLTFNFGIPPTTKFDF